MAEILEPGKATYVIEGMQNHAPIEYECNSLDDAVAIAFWAREDNTWYPERVKNRDGAVIIDDETLSQKVLDYIPPR